MSILRPEFIDRPGQRIPRKFSALTWAQMMGGAALREVFTKEVPDDFWSWDAAEDSTRVGIIACPCGESPEVPVHGTAICPNPECGRVFMLLGERMRVARFEPAELEQEPETVVH